MFSGLQFRTLSKCHSPFLWSTKSYELAFSTLQIQLRRPGPAAGNKTSLSPHRELNGNGE